MKLYVKSIKPYIYDRGIEHLPLLYEDVRRLFTLNTMEVELTMEFKRDGIEYGIDEIILHYYANPKYQLPTVRFSHLFNPINRVVNGYGGVSVAGIRTTLPYPPTHINGVIVMKVKFYYLREPGDEKVTRYFILVPSERRRRETWSIEPSKAIVYKRVKMRGRYEYYLETRKFNYPSRIEIHGNIEKIIPVNVMVGGGWGYISKLYINNKPIIKRVGGNYSKIVEPSVADILAEHWFYKVTDRTGEYYDKKIGKHVLAYLTANPCTDVRTFWLKFEDYMLPEILMRMET